MGFCLEADKQDGEAEDAYEDGALLFRNEMDTVLDDGDIVKRRTCTDAAVREGRTAAFFNLNIASVGGDVVQCFVVVKR